MFKYYLNRGLDAVEVLAKTFSERVWYLPDLICPDVIDTVRRHVGRIEFYYVNSDLTWEAEIKGSDPKIFYSIDYFGKESDLGRLAPPNTITIRDSVWFPYPFSPVESHHIWFNSLRKIFHGVRGIKGSNIISPYRISGLDEVPNLFYHSSLTWHEMNIRFENYNFCKEIFSEVAIKNHTQDFPSVFPIRLANRDEVLSKIDTKLPGMWVDKYDLSKTLYKELTFIPLDSRFNTEKLADLASKILPLI